MSIGVCSVTEPIAAAGDGNLPPCSPFFRAVSKYTLFPPVEVFTVIIFSSLEQYLLFYPQTLSRLFSVDQVLMV